MTVEELLGELWSVIETWGPIVLGVFGVFFVIVVTLVVLVFIQVFKSFNEHRSVRDELRHPYSRRRK